MVQIKDLDTFAALRTLAVHLGVLFFVIFPVAILVLVVTKFFIWMLFAGFERASFADGLFWIFSSNVDTEVLSMLELSVLMNWYASFIALVVFMIRAMLKIGELPSSTVGIVTLHFRLGYRVVALPLLAILICTIASISVYIVFDVVPRFHEAYSVVAAIVLLPAAIGTWIWAWGGTWIPLTQKNGLLVPNE